MKGNKPLRMMSAMVLAALALAHFTGQVNLLAPSWLWLAAFAGIMALQATFTGFCPASRMLGESEKKAGACCGG